jgi:superfamily I DNA/RNA helicase
LIIGGKQYLRQIVDHLTQRGFTVDIGRDRENASRPDRKAALALLREDPASNLGWRIILDLGDESLARSCVVKSTAEGLRLFDLVTDELKLRVLEEAAESVSEEDIPDPQEGTPQGEPLTIKATSFEGSKGLSAQQVFIVGLHAEEIPRDMNNIEDLEICRFIVGLTRAKKRCYLLLTKNFAGQWKQPSPFLSWIHAYRFEDVRVNAAYWEEREAGGK